ncbi:PepSY-associated TM helix domain-containing protein [Rheinheimera sp.]|uniref:PepSY-associated TM helix domain-containing protein n=1 Tax=Rheinheimera sp. TaxID=1869214 RepID=UPI00307EA973
MLLRTSSWARWMRWLHSYSAMLVLVLMLFFAITGITLNHPNWTLNAGKTTESLNVELPDTLPDLLALNEAEQASAVAAYVNWLRTEYQLKGGYSLNLMPDDAVLELDFKRPAGYASVVVDLENRSAEIDTEFGGYLALANDLHKGRYAGDSWKWLIDLTAVACILFALSGFYLLWRQPSQRDFGNATAVAGVVLALVAYIASLH